MKLAALKRAVSAKQAVFLDLDNTIYPYDICHRFALRQAHRAYVEKVEKITFEKFAVLYRRARTIVHYRFRGQAKSHSRLHYFQIMLQGRPPLCSALDFEKIYWDAFLVKMKLSVWVRPFLSFCKKKGAKVGIVTNLTTAIQMLKLKKLGLTKKIDFVVTSEEAGVEKPHPKFFRIALKKSGVKPSDVLTVGDDPRSDKIKGLAFFRIH